MASRRGCRSGLGCLLLLLLLAGGAWLARDRISDWMGRLEIGGNREPSERLAQSAERKLDRIAREGLTEEVRLSEAELQSILTYRSGASLPAGVEDPQIDVQDSIVVLSARIRPDDLEGFKTPDMVRSFMADSSRVLVGLVPAVERAGELEIQVRSLQVGELVLPSMALPLVVQGLASEGIRTSNGRIVTPMHRDVGAIRLDGDDVVLVPVP
ncbi:MAG: hypothetical protein ACR2GQ_10525 [Gemmatimonadota bacterium]|jgi:hypothetical protein